VEFEGRRLTVAEMSANRISKVVVETLEQPSAEQQVQPEKAS
jgi:hypothetical protein